MADRGFLRPRSVNPPAQGDFIYIPTIVGYEADTLAALVLQMNVGAGIQNTEPDWWWVVEQIQYETTVVKPEIGMNPAIIKYSAMVWLTKVIKN